MVGAVLRSSTAVVVAVAHHFIHFMTKVFVFDFERQRFDFDKNMSSLSKNHMMRSRSSVQCPVIINTFWVNCQHPYQHYYTGLWGDPIYGLWGGLGLRLREYIS